MTHTPGPWRVEHDYKPYVIGPNAGKSVCAITGTGAMLPEAPDNARLIAASPDLLEALKGLLISAEISLAPPHVTQSARAAIAKATGETQ